eukprot:CAMPEP_0119364118 /NCGR_PEP_ID=MMETSP1334-20130426/11035_1 /TAXON_ID=127549 /ORGANISM="Calcidiscus leptoporus, Strain RCC1130" /LENGTH=85 /DNA_ID=CAMNT_0007379739 /DNA_START=233 /DNA_END=490 /DNA_ORIENTATION=-
MSDAFHPDALRHCWEATPWRAAAMASCSTCVHAVIGPPAGHQWLQSGTWGRAALKTRCASMRAELNGTTSNSVQEAVHTLLINML